VAKGQSDVGDGYVAGVDIGGTFTDVVLTRVTDGKTTSAKVLTTPDDPVEGVMSGLAEARASVGDPEAEIRRIVHATTLASNLILERRGSRLAFVTTRGFGDMFEIGRQMRPESEQHNLTFRRPAPLVPRSLVLEVDERVLADGTVITPLEDGEGLRPLVERLRALAPEAVAVCLLHACTNPVHERQIASVLAAEMPEVYCVVSSAIWPEIGEYERAVTTVVSAYVGPTFSGYVHRLMDRLLQAGMGTSLDIMASNGGVLPSTDAADRAVYSIESGPAAGVIAARHLGQICGYADLISFDMGGTTAKVGVVQRGEASVTHDFTVTSDVSARASGVGEPVRIPVIDLAEVGAGGGSIAWVDAAGFLQIGPHSSAADPGPACYGFGGEEPTVTDADVVLGYLGEDSFLGGQMRIHPHRSHEAIGRTVAGPLGLSVPDAARSIYDLVNARMGSAIRVVTVRRGLDPREFAVVAFGGAGPGHVIGVAQEFDIETVIVPPSPGVRSAFGLLVADVVFEYISTHRIAVEDADPGSIAELFDDREREARAALKRAGVSPDDARLERLVDIRFQHQRQALAVAVPGGPITQATVDAADRGFRALYRDLYGMSPADGCEFVSFRVRALGPVPKPRLVEAPPGDGIPQRAVRGTRSAFFAASEGYVDTPVYSRAALQRGDRILGPAIIEEPDSTTVCVPGYVAEVDAYLNLVVHRQ
jgi:N-methylhydantoinase A